MCVCDIDCVLVCAQMNVGESGCVCTLASPCVYLCVFSQGVNGVSFLFESSICVTAAISCQQIGLSSVVL